MGVIHGRDFGPVMKPGILMVDMQWFPWASKRNIAECVVNFVNEGKKDIAIFAITTHSEKAIAEYVCKHGIMRRVGTFHQWHAEPSALFESR